MRMVFWNKGVTQAFLLRKCKSSRLDSAYEREHMMFELELLL